MPSPASVLRALACAAAVAALASPLAAQVAPSPSAIPSPPVDVASPLPSTAPVAAPPSGAAAAPADPAAPASAAAAGPNPADFDASVEPSADFYRYAAGGWLASNPIPADRTSWGTFNEVQKRNEARLRAIVESPDQTSAPEGSEPRKIGDLYAACEDLPQIETAGIAAVKPQLDAIDALAAPGAIVPLAATLAASGVSSPAFAFGSEQDPAHATHVIASIGQGGLTLPTRDYYLAKDARSSAIRAAYRTEVRTVFGLAGDDPDASAREAAAVLDVETRLATVSKTPDQLRDPFANYAPVSLARLEALTPDLRWSAFFRTLGIDRSRLPVVDMSQPAFFSALDLMTRTVPLANWKSYLRWRTLDSGGEALPKPYRDASFAFRKVLFGLEAEPPRERTCAAVTSRALGFAVGSIYVRDYFSAAARARARREIELIKAQLRDDIRTVAWMGPKTRAAALAKLAKLNTAKVGYPDRPRSYASLAISRTDFLGDALAADAFEFARDAAKIGKPLDRGEWGLTPQTINAYYDPSNNEIVIPAGILQAPFFSEDADDASNFGGIGAIIGHEMTHGFDDEGSDYDGDGNLRRIVTPADAARFHARVACIVRQADRFVASDGLHLDGKLVAGEAAADLGGTTLAYRALAASPAAPAASAAGGFTPAQRFYLSWAQVWRENQRPQAERAQILGDPHPVSRYRVDATLSNEAPFLAAFAVKPGDAMWTPPARRCAVW